MKPLLDSKVEKEPIVITIGEKEIVNTLKEPDSLGFVLVSKPKDNISPNDKEPIATEIKPC